MPCGVETTRQIVELMKASDRPITIIDITQRLGITRSSARDGINNLLDTGTPLIVKQLRVPGRPGRPERGYALRQESAEVPVYWGPNFHRTTSA